MTKEKISSTERDKNLTYFFSLIAHRLKEIFDMYSSKELEPSELAKEQFRLLDEAGSLNQRASEVFASNDRVTFDQVMKNEYTFLRITSEDEGSLHYLWILLMGIQGKVHAFMPTNYMSHGSENNFFFHITSPNHDFSVKEVFPKVNAFRIGNCAHALGYDVVIKRRPQSRVTSLEVIMAGNLNLNPDPRIVPASLDELQPASYSG